MAIGFCLKGKERWESYSHPATEAIHDILELSVTTFDRSGESFEIYTDVVP